MGGGVPPIPLSFFGHNDFPLGGGGGAPLSIPLRRKSAKNSYFWQNKMLILALLLDYLLRKIYTDFLLRRGGGTFLSAKGFLAK